MLPLLCIMTRSHQPLLDDHVSSGYSPLRLNANNCLLLPLPSTPDLA